MKIRHSGTSPFPEDLPAHRPHYAHGRMIYDSSLWTGVGAWEGLSLEPPLSWVLWRRWSWAIRQWALQRKFRCQACGTQCDSAPANSGFWQTTAVCPEHCPEHDFEYDRDQRCRCCITCGKPEDY